jgi:hypothetical protein
MNVYSKALEKLQTSQLDPKTKQLISYIVDKHSVSTITSLIKLCYLADLVDYQRKREQISKFSYIRWHYGPYDSSISDYLLSLVNEKVLESELEYTLDGNEYFRYRIGSKEYDKSLLSAEELEIIDAVLNSLKSYGPSALVKVAYETKPMKALKATIGGNENLGAKIDLAAK